MWVSLEEAEPISDISWAIRVLQPPPEQENAQFGELGQGRGTPPKFPARITPSVPLPHIVRFLGITSKRPPVLLVHGHGE